MVKRTNKSCLILLFLLCGFAGFGQMSKPDCGKYIAGSFREIKDNDTVILFRGLQYWIEADVTHHCCNVYKIKWENSCKLTLLFNISFSENKHVKLTGSDIVCSYRNSDSNSITYAISEINKSKRDVKSNLNKSVSLINLKEPDTWKYLIDADTLLFSDTNEIKKLYGYPERVFDYNVPDFFWDVTDSSGIRFADYIFSLLKKGDINPAYNYASPIMKNNSSDTMFRDYNNYIEAGFGKLLDYQFISREEDKSALFKTPRIDNYIFDAQFEKVKRKVKMCLSIAVREPNPLIKLNVVADSANDVTFIDTLTANFWKLLKQHEFKKIYMQSSPLLQKKVTDEQAEKILSELYDRSHLEEYRLFFQTFNVIERKGFIDAEFNCKVQGVNFSVALYFSLENGEYKLSALNDSVY